MSRRPAATSSRTQESRREWRQIGRASCRERGEISVGAVSLKKKKKHNKYRYMIRENGGGKQKRQEGEYIVRTDSSQDSSVIVQQRILAGAQGSATSCGTRSVVQ